MLNVALKIISKALSEKLEKVLPSRFCLFTIISDVIEIAKIKKLEDFLVTLGTEKGLDSLDHNFLVSTLKKYGFGKNVILWIKSFLKDQESRVINSSTTTKYFSLGRSCVAWGKVRHFLV